MNSLVLQRQLNAKDRVLVLTQVEFSRLHNKELHSLYRSANIARVIKSRRLRWVGHVVRMEEGMSAFKILTGTPTGKIP